MNYKTENQILEVIEGFESCTIKRDAWGHPEHLIVAYHYSLNNDYETALEKMRDGIFNLLETFEVDLKKEMPYHETLTVFWMNTINEYAKGQDGYSVDVVNKMIENNNASFFMVSQL